MSTPWELPTSLTVGGEEWKIRTDFRAVLDILQKFNDPDYDMEEKWGICLEILYEDFDIENSPPQNIVTEMQKQAVEFIDMGIRDDGKQKPTLMDWEKDASIIIPSVNRVVGQEVRAMQYMHWWTFLGAYMEIGESLFSQIISIRAKRAKRKKLEKWELDFLKENKELIELKRKKPERSAEEKAALDELFGRK